MKKIKSFYSKLPNWLKPNAEQIAAAKVVLKAWLKGVVIAGSGLISYKLGASPEVAVLVAALTHPIIKWLDPTDPQLGISSIK